ncbi:hypothetical protein BDA99DRAFT_529043 [Phascolomyces articulosus]|uniref:Sulfate transporter n=1 Tax=Phascolomyces articulosus TaxID=60185 RepID=A0AAD5JWS0_9FUNG|nr:hypothetical protein BDA99DRAFT_529043 [Phascolomyces articulosus]
MMNYENAGVAAVIFFLGITRTIHLVGSFTPVAVVRGIQLGAAASLIKKAHSLTSSLDWKITTDTWSDNTTWLLFSFIFVMGCYRTRVPSALILFIIGLIFALIRMFGTERDSLGLPWPVAGGHYPDTIIRPTPEEFRTGFGNAGVGQIPLTALNSVIALSALIDDLFPDRHADTATISMSIGVMNLIGCWFGSMPFCHGSGGLAGQYRFGARSEVSVILLGMGKLLLGIIFGNSLVGLLQVFPKSILGVMLFISGVELASAARSVNKGVEDEDRQKENWTILLVTMGTIIAYSNVGIGFVSGLITALLLAIQRLGFYAWYICFIQGIKDIPSKWKQQDVFIYKQYPSVTVKSYYSDSENSERQQPDELFDVDPSHRPLKRVSTSNSYGSISDTTTATLSNHRHHHLH